MNETNGKPPLDRGTLFRDALMLQVKLAFDGFRDLALVPLSITAAVISFLRPGRTPGTEFYDLLQLGRRSERWIDLFGAAERVHDKPMEADVEPFGNIDRVADWIETYVREERRTGRLSGEARERIRRALEDLRSDTSKGGGS